MAFQDPYEPYFADNWRSCKLILSKSSRSGICLTGNELQSIRFCCWSGTQSWFTIFQQNVYHSEEANGSDKNFAGSAASAVWNDMGLDKYYVGPVGAVSQ